MDLVLTRQDASEESTSYRIIGQRVRCRVKAGGGLASIMETMKGNHDRVWS